MTSYYIASKLENAPQVQALKKTLDDAGWRHTYDWTVHGSVQREGAARIAEVANAEAVGVLMATVVIVLLPGGRGTHTELGMAIGQVDMAIGLRAMGLVPLERKRILIYSPDPDADFGSNGTCCAFYHHPFVERFSSMDDMINSLLGDKTS